LIGAGHAKAEDAAALETQYKICAKHYIPTEKCTPEIYQQLKDKDDAVSANPYVFPAVNAAKEYRQMLKNPDSMQIRAAVVGGYYGYDDVCLEVGGQNSLGGQTVATVKFYTDEKGKRHFLSSEDGATGYILLRHGCSIPSLKNWEKLAEKQRSHHKPVPPFPPDVTDQVNQVLKDEK
jgi:hypothetical protein